jgi:hypothetical protein
MVFENEIALCLEQIRELENILQCVSGKLDDLKQRLQAMSDIQHPEISSLSVKELMENPQKDSPPPVFLGDRITKTIYADLKKSLSLNDRFRIQKSLF